MGQSDSETLTWGWRLDTKLLLLTLTIDIHTIVMFVFCSTKRCIEVQGKASVLRMLISLLFLIAATTYLRKYLKAYLRIHYHI